jgi:hypothetical protein
VQFAAYWKRWVVVRQSALEGTGRKSQTRLEW